jgi:hypothetical protein
MVLLGDKTFFGMAQKCHIESPMITAVQGVIGRLALPLPTMNRLKQTELVPLLILPF